MKAYLILSTLLILSSCSNEPVNDQPTDQGGPIINPPVGFEFVVIGDKNNSETEKFREIRIPSRNNF